MEKINKVTRREKGIRTVYIVAFVLLFISYIITLYANRELVKQSSRVEHTNKIIKTLEDATFNILSAETGLRGYLLSKDLRFLFPYYGTKERSDSILKEMRKLIVDNPVQAQRFNELSNLMSQRFEILAYQVKTFDAHNRVVTDSMLMRQETGKMIMDNIRSTASLMEREQNRLLEQGETRLRKNMDAITAITIITLGLVISLLIFGFMTYMQVSRQRKKAEQDIREYQLKLNQRIDELDKANAELIKMRSLEKFAVTGRIARTIGHEVRNPLTNIILAIEQLKVEMNDPNKDKTYLYNMVDRNCARINQLISDLLDSTKVSELNFEMVTVNELIDETLEDARDRIALTNVTVKKELSQMGNNRLYVDKARMKIALLNLFTNALEAMQGKQGSELTIKTVDNGENSTIIIKDNGPGMDEETLSRIFEPYYTTKKSGNGLGLTNTQNIILNHKGDISAESTPGEGTRFMIVLKNQKTDK